MKEKPLVVVIGGPTAVGKSDFAVSLAKILQTYGIYSEIVSADSRQVYRGLDLLSGKITKKEMQRVPHHMLDIASATRTYAVSRYKISTTKIIKKLHKENKIPIIVGGTGFYIDAILHKNTFPEVKPNKKLRASLEKKSSEFLYNDLKKKDPIRAESIDPHNKVRLIRALEIIETLGFVPNNQKELLYTPIYVYLDMEDEKLKKKIYDRILLRIKKGMLREAKKMHEQGLSYKKMESLGLECRYASLYLQKKINKEEFIEQLFSATWHYVKRQRTWFKKRFED